MADRLDLKRGPEGRWRWSGGRIFHYGWVKAPAVMTQKKREQLRHYHPPGVVPEAEVQFAEGEAYEYPLYEALNEFRGSHPAVMAERVGRSRRLRRRRNRWLQWRFYREVFTHGFKG